jgi:hypothetical protein
MYRTYLYIINYHTIWLKIMKCVIISQNVQLLNEVVIGLVFANLKIILSVPPISKTLATHQASTA